MTDWLDRIEQRLQSDAYGMARGLTLDEARLLIDEVRRAGDERVVDPAARGCPMCGVRSREAWPPLSHLHAQEDD